MKEFMTKAGLQDRITFSAWYPFSYPPLSSQRDFVYHPFTKVLASLFLRALHSGIPVVAATGSCLEEAGEHSL